MNNGVNIRKYFGFLSTAKIKNTIIQIATEVAGTSIYPPLKLTATIEKLQYNIVPHKLNSLENLCLSRIYKPKGPTKQKIPVTIKIESLEIDSDLKQNGS